jgi:hypothetical protein
MFIRKSLEYYDATIRRMPGGVGKAHARNQHGRPARLSGGRPAGARRIQSDDRQYATHFQRLFRVARGQGVHPEKPCAPMEKARMAASSGGGNSHVSGV